MNSLLWALVKDAINEGLLVTDLCLHILDINRNLEIMLEIDSWRGKELVDVFPKKVIEVINNLVQELEATGVCLCPKRINYVTSKGVMLPLLVTVDSIMNKEGEKVGYLFVFKDAIIQDEIGTLSWMNTVKTAYISEVAKQFYLPFHNLDRNLDDYIEFYADAVEGKELLLDAQKELKKLRNVFEKFLEYSRIDVVCEKIILQQVDIAKIFHQALLLVVADHIHNKIELTVEGDSRVITDAFKLEQLFVSLIDQFAVSLCDKDKLQVCIKEAQSQVLIDLTLIDKPVPEPLKELPTLDCETLNWRQYQSLERNLLCWILTRLSIRSEVLLLPDREIFRLLIPKEL